MFLKIEYRENAFAIMQNHRYQQRLVFKDILIYFRRKYFKKNSNKNDNSSKTYSDRYYLCFGSSGLLFRLIFKLFFGMLGGFELCYLSKILFLTSWSKARLSFSYIFNKSE